MEIVKTKKTHFNVQSLALGWLPKTIVLKIRKERKCWSCGDHFEKLEDERISLCMTDKGNKIICNTCALKMADDGVKVGVNRLTPQQP